MASHFDESDSWQLWRRFRPWPLQVPVRVAPRWQDEVFTQQGILIQGLFSSIWLLTVTDAGILQIANTGLTGTVPGVFLNDLRTDSTTWQLSTGFALLQTVSATFDATKPDQITLVSSGGVTWYLHITSAGILRTDKSENWVQLSGFGLVDKLVAIRTASSDIQPAPGSPTTNNLAAAYWDADEFGDDGISQITLSAVSFPAGAEIAAIGACYRMNDNGDMYAAVMALQSSVSTLFLYKFLAGVLTVLGSQVMGGVAAGDVVSCSCDGVTISALYNGDALISVTDTSITSGQPGVYAKYTTTGDSTVRGDDWNAGQFAGVSGELISYQDATLTSAYNYQIGTRIRRGVSGSTISDHVIGSAFLRLDEEVAEWDYDPQLIGQLVFFKFTSFNLRGMQEENIANVTAYPFQITGESLGLLTPAHATYRPTSNPLTATDAGTTATISVASFAMRIPGISDIVINSGSISGATFGTLYYVFYDDPTFTGGTVAFQITTTKETALNGAGRFFVGSILTPADGAFDTIGNDDGGSGAQYGIMSRVSPISAGSTVFDGHSTITNISRSIDLDFTTSGQLQANASGTGNDTYALQTWSFQVANVSRSASAVLQVYRNVVNTLTALPVSDNQYHLDYSTDGTNSWTTIESLNNTIGTGIATGKATAEIPIGIGNQVIFVRMKNTAPSGGTGSITSTVWEVLLDYTQ